MNKVTEYISPHPDETLRFGSQIAQQLDAGSVVAFFGGLGAGKTTLIKGICSALAVKETVTSPTFTLINEYTGRLPVYHFDFYRIKSDAEVLDLGLEQYFYADGICLIEWPEVVHALLPVQRLEVHLSLPESMQETHRKIEIYDS